MARPGQVSWRLGLGQSLGDRHDQGDRQERGVKVEADSASTLSQSHRPQAVIGPDPERGQHHSEWHQLQERPGL